MKSQRRKRTKSLRAIRAFLGAVKYLTIIPIPASTAQPGRSAFYFPVVGAALGAEGGCLMSAGQGYIPFTLLALLVLAFWTVITGGRHEDGVAGAVDPARAGTHGTLAVLLLVLIRWQALSSLTLDPVPALAAALGLGQAAVVALAWCASPAGSGSAPRLSETLSTGIALAAIALGMALAFWPGARVASFLLGGTPAIVLLARVYFTRRFGGVTSECLGATGQLAETWCLVVYTCRPCTL